MVADGRVWFDGGHGQKARVMDAGTQIALSLSTQSGIPAHGMVPPTFKMAAPHLI